MVNLMPNGLLDGLMGVNMPSNGLLTGWTDGGGGGVTRKGNWT